MNRTAKQIDDRRALAAQVAGKDIETLMAHGEREEAQRSRKEMEAQVVARRAARECGCYFDEQGEAHSQAAQRGLANA